MASSEDSGATETANIPRPGEQDGFLEELGLACANEASRLGCPEVTVDLQFLVFLRRVSRFGFFHFGPLAIDVRIVEALVERQLPRGRSVQSPGLAEDAVRFSRLLMEEAKRSGTRRVDELVYLLAFMRWREGIPHRVFGELGVSPEAVFRFARDQRPSGTDPERLNLMTQGTIDAYNAYAKRVWGWDEWQLRKTKGYNAVFLDGIWLRAPYLHNGSVPTLADLLLPPEQRPTKFHRGSDLYDQRRVGFVTEGPQVDRMFLYDTSLPGNRNIGHTYGTDLPDEAKSDLLEYLKTL